MRGRSAIGSASLGSTTTTTTTPSLGTASPSPFAGPTQEYSYAVSYAECMRTHGVSNVPNPTKSSHGFSFNPTADSNSPHFSSANKACKHLLPDNGGPPTATQIAAETAKLVKYAKCMRRPRCAEFPRPDRFDPPIRIFAERARPEFASIPNRAESLQIDRRSGRFLSDAAIQVTRRLLGSVPSRITDADDRIDRLDSRCDRRLGETVEAITDRLTEGGTMCHPGPRRGRVHLGYDGVRHPTYPLADMIE